MDELRSVRLINLWHKAPDGLRMAKSFSEISAINLPKFPQTGQREEVFEQASQGGGDPPTLSTCWLWEGCNLRCRHPPFFSCLPGWSQGLWALEPSML